MRLNLPAPVAGFVATVVSVGRLLSLQIADRMGDCASVFEHLFVRRGTLATDVATS